MSSTEETFTEQDAAKEEKEMTEDEKSEANASLYGQVHPNETPELVSRTLRELEKELEKIPSEKKIGWEKAKDKCPDLTGEKHKLMFLRCEVFNVDLAAKRLVQYWDKRIEVYGESRAFLPLTFDGALKDDEPTLFHLTTGYITLTGTTDDSGRSIIYMRPRFRPLDEEGYDREAMLRAIWYVLHASLELESAQKRGVIFLGCPRGVVPAQFDRKLMGAYIGSIRGCIPARVGALHACHSPGFATKIVFPIAKLLMGKRLRARFKSHTGKDEKVIAKLEKFGLSKDRLPEDLGGMVTINQSRWIEERREAGL